MSAFGGRLSFRVPCAGQAGTRVVECVPTLTPGLYLTRPFLSPGWDITHRPSCLLVAHGWMHDDEARRAAYGLGAFIDWTAGAEEIRALPYDLLEDARSWIRGQGGSPANSAGGEQLAFW